MSRLKMMVRNRYVLKAVVPLFVLFFFFILSFSAYAQSYGSNLTRCGVVAYEGSIVDLTPTAYDPDPEIGPAGAFIWAFSLPFNVSGMWQTFKGDRGIYPFWVSVSDGEYTDVKRDCVELLPNNRNPILLPIDDIYITRGDTTKISATCYDPDNDRVEINYKFMGKDVAFISYEPPGVYGLEAICTDGFGGVAIQYAKLHILMEKEVVQANAKKVFIPPAAPKPSAVELVLPRQNDTAIDVVSTPAVCAPCPANDLIDVVVYDTIETVEGPVQKAPTFVVESKPAPKVDEARPVVNNDVVIEEKLTSCESGRARKAQINKVIGTCCD